MLLSTLLPGIVLAVTANALAFPEPQAGSTVSTDGSCGKGVTCQGSTFGSCCSTYGWCGSTSDYCGTGCQSAFGTCSGSSAASSVKPASSAAPSVASSAASTKASSTSTKVSSTSVAQSPTSSPATPTSAKPATPTASTPAAGCATQAVSNPSFEDGLTSWTAAGGATLESSTSPPTWSFAPTDGTKYIRLQSSAANTTSTLTQRVTGLDFQAWTLSYDWSYMVVTTGRGPPSTDCTLSVTLANWVTIDSWTRPGNAGGNGRVQSTLSLNIGEGDLVFKFACTSTSYNALVMVDNVSFCKA